MLVEIVVSVVAVGVIVGVAYLLGKSRERRKEVAREARRSRQQSYVPRPLDSDVEQRLRRHSF